MSLAKAKTELEAQVGQQIFEGDWMTVDQPRIDAFAEATGDFQWIHVDAQRAAQSPFETTIAHGYLTLSLIPMLCGTGHADAPLAEGVRMGINYGANRLRFPSPVPCGSRLRAREDLIEVTQVGDDALQLIYKTTIDIENAAKPACVVERVVRLYFDAA